MDSCISIAKTRCFIVINIIHIIKNRKETAIMTIVTNNNQYLIIINVVVKIALIMCIFLFYIFVGRHNNVLCRNLSCWEAGNIIMFPHKLFLLFLSLFLCHIWWYYKRHNVVLSINPLCCFFFYSWIWGFWEK